MRIKRGIMEIAGKAEEPNPGMTHAEAHEIGHYIGEL